MTGVHDAASARAHASGTPAGVGASRNSFLRAGDTVEVQVDGLGAVVSPVRAE